MTSADIEAVAACHLASWQMAFRGLLSDGLLDELTHSQFIQTWRQLVSVGGRTNLVADGAQEIIGFVSFGAYRPGPSNDPASEQIAEVYGIYVHPTWWRAGAGRMLFRIALEELHAAGFQTVKVWTMAGNRRSRSFYEAHGLRLSPSARTSERSGEKFEEVQYEIGLEACDGGGPVPC